jgi:hypothetical protein
MARRKATYEELTEMYNDAVTERDELQEKLDTVITAVRGFEDDNDDDDGVYVDVDDDNEE